jgi:F0F1-type ATP synthase epsilon subunit
MPLKLKVVTTKKILIESNDVDYCEIPAKCGIEGILPGHINFISFLNEGKIKYKIKDEHNEIDAKEGFVEFSDNTISILLKG